jgi:hypothetical protein
MTRWNKGSEVIERLLDARHLERVPADADTVTALIATADLGGFGTELRFGPV